MKNPDTPLTTATGSPVAHHRLGILLVFVSTIAWSSAGLFVRLLPYDVWTIIVWRGIFAILFIGGFVFWRFGWATVFLVRKLGMAGTIVVLCSTAAITLFPAAFQSTSVANATTILAALPFVTAAIAWGWLRERPSAQLRWRGLLSCWGRPPEGPGSGIFWPSLPPLPSPC